MYRHDGKIIPFIVFFSKKVIPEGNQILFVEGVTRRDQVVIQCESEVEGVTLPMGLVRDVVSERLSVDESFTLVGLQLRCRADTDKCYWLYWVPEHCVKLISDSVLEPWAAV